MTDQNDREQAQVHDLEDHGGRERSAVGRDAVEEAPAPGDEGAVDLDQHLDDAGTHLSAEEERERLLAATVAHAMAQDYQYSLAPAGPRPLATWWKWIVSMVLFTAAFLVLAAPPAWLAGPTRPSLTALDRERGRQATLFLQASAVAAHWVEERALPRSLAELDQAYPEVRYVRSNARVFQLVLYRPDGSVLVWDSSAPSQASQLLGERWVLRPLFP